jgi:hypothetical protein
MVVSFILSYAYSFGLSFYTLRSAVTLRRSVYQFHSMPIPSAFLSILYAALWRSAVPYINFILCLFLWPFSLYPTQRCDARSSVYQSLCRIHLTGYSFYIFSLFSSSNILYLVTNYHSMPYTLGLSRNTPHGVAHLFLFSVDSRISTMPCTLGFSRFYSLLIAVYQLCHVP